MLEDEKNELNNQRYFKEDTLTVKDVKKRKPTTMDFLFQTIDIAVPKVGDLVEGDVLFKKGQNMFVDLGPFGTGVIYGREFINARDIIRKLEVGEHFTSKVIELENEDGYVGLSLREAAQEIVWSEARELMRKKESVSLTVVGVNKGGLVIEWSGVQGFLPTSQLRANHYPRVDGGDKNKILEELKKLVGQSLMVTIITADPKEEKLIFSEKYTESVEMQKVISKYKVDDIIEGNITGVVDFGIFIKLEEGLEGLAHISELDWILVEDPASIFSVGEKIKAKIIGVEDGKISLSVKALTPNPWVDIKDKYKKGDIIEGVVLRFNRHGSLVSVSKGVCGLVHISEFKSESDMKEKLTVGKKYPFQITLFDPKERKLTFTFLEDGVAKEAKSSTSVDDRPKAKPFAENEKILMEKSEKKEELADEKKDKADG